MSIAQAPGPMDDRRTRVLRRTHPRRTDARARATALVLFGVLAGLVVLIGLVVISGGRAPAPNIIAGTSPSTGPIGSPATARPPATPAPISTPTVTPPPTAPPTATLEPTPPPEVTPSPPRRTPRPTPDIPIDASLDAALARCPTAAEIALVDSRITMTFIDDPTAPELVCRAADGSADLTRLQERAYQGVLVMRRIKFDEPLPWTNGRTMFRWFTRTVSGIRFQDVENSYCCFGEREIVIRATTNMVHLLDNHWAAREEPHWYGLMALPGLLAHEARHAEGYFHTCGNDDQTFEEMGAWAVHKLWFVWLAEQANDDYMTPVDAPADLYTTVAADSADDYDSRFCEGVPPDAESSMLRISR